MVSVSVGVADTCAATVRGWIVRVSWAVAEGRGVEVRGVGEPAAATDVAATVLAVAVEALVVAAGATPASQAETVRATQSSHARSRGRVTTRNLLRAAEYDRGRRSTVNSAIKDSLSRLNP